MVMFTQLLRFAVEDDRGKRAPIADLSIALLDDDYPPVTHVLFDHEGEVRQTEWANVSAIDYRKGAIRITDLAAPAANEGRGDILLARDIMDALILDLLGRRTTRVSDLLLEQTNGSLRLKGADTGLSALLRRVTRGLIGKSNDKNLFDWKYVEFLRGDPSAVDNGAGYRLRITRLPAGEIARLADYIPYLHAAELLKLLPDGKAANVLQAMSLERQLQVIEELDEEEAVNLLQRMAPDLATDLLGRLHIDTMRRYVTMLPEDRREKIIELLQYPEYSVGGVMINDVISMSATVKAKEAQEKLHDCIKSTEFVSLIFVIDDEAEGRLRGAVSLRKVLAAEPEKTLEDLMDPYLETLDPFSSASDAAYRIVGGQLEAMAVTNTHGRLLGAMTISAAISLTVGAGRVRVFS